MHLTEIWQLNLHKILIIIIKQIKKVSNFNVAAEKTFCVFKSNTFS